MERRKFIKAGVIGAAAVPLATPAIAQGVKQWKMVSGLKEKMKVLTKWSGHLSIDLDHRPHVQTNIDSGTPS